MARLILLDADPLGDVAKPRGKATGDRAKAWVAGLVTAGDRIGFSEVTDFEIRRELLRCDAHAGITWLDQLASRFEYHAITTEVMRRAAGLWAAVRKVGGPTAHEKALDADCILAAHALVFGGSDPDLQVIVATVNVKHLSRFPGVIAGLWPTIA